MQRKWVGIATRYGLDGPGIEYRWERDFPHQFNRLRGSPSLLENGHPVSLEGVKRPGRLVHHQPLSKPRLKKEYIYTNTPLVYFMVCSKAKFTFTQQKPNLFAEGCTHNHKSSCTMSDIFLAGTYRKIQPINK